MITSLICVSVMLLLLECNELETSVTVSYKLAKGSKVEIEEIHGQHNDLISLLRHV